MNYQALLESAQSLSAVERAMLISALVSSRLGLPSWGCYAVNVIPDNINNLIFNNINFSEIIQWNNKIAE